MARPRIEVTHTFMVDGKRAGQSTTKVPNRRLAMSVDSLKEEHPWTKGGRGDDLILDKDQKFERRLPGAAGRKGEPWFKHSDELPDEQQTPDDEEFSDIGQGKKVPKGYKAPPPLRPKRPQGSGAPARPREKPPQRHEASYKDFLNGLKGGSPKAPNQRVAMSVDSLREMRHGNALNEMERGPVKRMPGDDEDMERGIPEGVSPRGNEYKYRMNDMKPDQYLRNKEDADRILNDKRMRGRSEGDAFGAPDKGRKVPKDYKEPPSVTPKRPQGSGAPPTPRTGPPRQHMASLDKSAVPSPSTRGGDDTDDGGYSEFLSGLVDKGLDPKRLAEGLAKDQAAKATPPMLGHKAISNVGSPTAESIRERQKHFHQKGPKPLPPASRHKLPEGYIQQNDDGTIRSGTI